MTKDRLRKLYRQKRKDLTEEVYQNLSRTVAARFIHEVDLSEIAVLHTFLPIYPNREPDTWLIIRHIWEYHPHIQIVVPRIANSGFEMESLLLTPDTSFKDNKYGILEPAGDLIIDPGTIDLVVVPLMTFDRRGFRVGYGKGYYDRFFSGIRKNFLKVGLCFFEPESCISDINTFDIPLNQVVTPLCRYCF